MTGVQATVEGDNSQQTPYKWPGAVKRRSNVWYQGNANQTQKGF